MTRGHPNRRRRFDPVSCPPNWRTNNHCVFMSDGVCDEPSAGGPVWCDPGTDCVDCGYCAGPPTWYYSTYGRRRRGFVKYPNPPHGTPTLATPTAEPTEPTAQPTGQPTGPTPAPTPQPLGAGHYVAIVGGGLSVITICCKCCEEKERQRIPVTATDADYERAMKIYLRVHTRYELPPTVYRGWLGECDSSEETV